MRQHILSKILEKYQKSIDMYSAALELSESSDLNKLFSGYLQRRISLANYLHQLTGNKSPDWRNYDYGCFSLQELINLSVANEAELIKLYESYIGKSIEPYDVINKIMRLHLNELKASYKNMTVVVPYYAPDYALTA